jgi:DNA-directed RNA polymerase subunit RPC12/RpoP
MLLQLLVVAVSFALAYGLLKLLRRPIRKSVRLTTVTCPTCGTTPHRVHRGPITKAISEILPLRTFRCSTCKRKFVRVKPLTEKIGAHS